MAIGTLTLDCSEMYELAAKMKNKLSPKEFERLMKRTLLEVGRKVKTAAGKEVRKEYAVTNGFVSPAIGAPKVEGSGAGLACRIKTKGPKGTIGGTFAASGGWYGYDPPPYRIKAKILKGTISTLPSAMGAYGGQPPFRNLGGKGYLSKRSKLDKVRVANRLGTAVYTRKDGAFHAPLTSIAALAVPQMVMNKAAPGIENEMIGEYAAQRLIHNFEFMFNS